MKSGLKFFKYTPEIELKSLFDRLLSIFQELLLSTSGNIMETLDWMSELDARYKLFNERYRLSDFMNELIHKKYIEPIGSDQFKSSSKLELSIRKNTFESLFGKIRKNRIGTHRSKFTGSGDGFTDSNRPFEFGDPYPQINSQESIKNALLRNGIQNFKLEEEDLISFESYQSTQCNTVLMIDISHSMILYGEDRITPAKKVALALSYMIQNYYPKDQFDIVVFGDDAWQIPLSELPYLEVGPYHTNTVAGLNLAIDILSKKKNPNKNIFMITDGKPTCIKRGREYYKNSSGLDNYILSRTLALARKCRKLQIDITTFMVTTDPYLVNFVEQFSAEANGKALYTNLEGLGDHILISYEKNKRKRTQR